MSSLDQLQINTRIELEVNDPEHAGKYFSRVMDVTNKEIKVMAPTVQGEVLLLSKGTPVNITFVGDRALYSFDTRINGRFSKPIPGYAVNIPKKIHRIQRREFVRLELKIKSRYRIVNDVDLLAEESQPFTEGYILDISGGGVRFYSEEEVEIGSFLEIILDIDKLQDELLICKVVRCTEREDGGYEIGVAFIDMPANIQDQIISWIFDKQRELRRKGFA